MKFSINVICLLCVLVPGGYADTGNTDWDYILSAGKHLHLIASSGRNGDRRTLLQSTWNTSRIMGVAYDPVRSRIFFSDIKHSDASIFSLHIDSEENAEGPVPILLHEMWPDSKIEALAYDQQSSSLYWTDSAKRVIARIDGENSISIIHNLTEGAISHGIAVDSCQQILYWSEKNSRGSSSIKQLALKSMEISTVVSQIVMSPKGVAISPNGSYLYWVGKGPGEQFQIQGVDLGTKDRYTLLEGDNMDPFSVAVINSGEIIWSDWAHKTVWKLNPQMLGKPEDIWSSNSLTPMGIISRQQTFDPHVCPNDISSSTSKTHLTTIVEDSAHELNVSKEVNFVTKEFRTTTVSPAAVQFHDDYQQCYCENGATCLYDSVQNKSFCICASGYYGQTCEAWDMLSSTFTTARLRALSVHVLLAIAGLLLVIVFCLSAVLAYCVRQRRCRGREIVRKRTSVSIRRKRTRNSCDIDIEDCCNMNICETPCYETGMPRPVRCPPAKEDKQLLLPES